MQNKQKLCPLPSNPDFLVDFPLELQAGKSPKNSAYITNTNFYTPNKEIYITKSQQITVIPIPAPIPFTLREIKKTRNFDTFKSDKKPQSIIQSITSTILQSDIKSKQLEASIEKSIITPFKNQTARSNMVSPAKFRLTYENDENTNALLLAGNQDLTQRAFKETITPLKRNMLTTRRKSPKNNNPQSCELPNLKYKLTEIARNKSIGKKHKIIKPPQCDAKNENLLKKITDTSLEYCQAMRRMWGSHNIPEQNSMSDQLEAFIENKRKMIKEHTKSKLSKKNIITTTQVTIDPQLTLLSQNPSISNEPLRNIGYMNAAVTARKERLRRIYETVLYRDGDKSAQDLYKQYFAENMDLDRIEKEIETKKNEKKIVQMDSLEPKQSLKEAIRKISYNEIRAKTRSKSTAV